MKFELFLTRNSGQLRLIRTRFLAYDGEPGQAVVELKDASSFSYEPFQLELLPRWDTPQKGLVLLFLKSFASVPIDGTGISAPQYALAGPLFDAIRKTEDAKGNETWVQRMFGLSTGVVPSDLFYREGSAGRSPFVKLGRRWGIECFQAWLDDVLLSNEQYLEICSELNGGAPQKKEVASHSEEKNVAPKCSTTNTTTSQRMWIGLPDTGEFFFGREEELRIIEAAEKTGLPRVLSFVGWGGMGKSSILNAWLAKNAAAGLSDEKTVEGSRVFAWTFYSQGAREDVSGASTHRFFEFALNFFEYDGPPISDATYRATKLVELIRKRHTVLILDGLEPLQFGEQSSDWGRFRPQHQALKIMLKNLAASMNGICILTSRAPIRDLASFTQGDRFKEHSLSRLSTEAGCQLLTRLGISADARSPVRGAADDVDISLSMLVERFDGHPLALDLLGRYLAEFEEGKPTKLNAIPPLTCQPELGGHAFRVMERYKEVFTEHELVAEYGLLLLLSLFDRPVGERVIGALLKSPDLEVVDGSLRKLDKEGWRHVLARLKRFGFLKADSSFFPKLPDDRVRLTQKAIEAMPQPSPFGPAGIGSGSAIVEREFLLDLHPLIREHFAEALRKTFPKSVGLAHERIYENLRDNTVVFPNTLVEMEPLLRAVRHGCRAGRHADVLNEILEPRLFRGGIHFISEKLGGCDASLSALSLYFTADWAETIRSIPLGLKARVINLAGLALLNAGRMAEAQNVFRFQAEVSKQLGQEDPRLTSFWWLSEATAHSLRSEALRPLGKLVEAEKEAVAAVLLIEKYLTTEVLQTDLLRSYPPKHPSGDPIVRMVAALRLYDLHNPTSTHFDIPTRFVWAYARWAASLHLQGKFSEAKQKFERAEAPFIPHGSLDEPGIDHSLMLLDLGEHQKVLSRAQRAIPLVEKFGYLRDLGRWQLCAANALLQAGENKLQKARQYSAHAMEKLKLYTKSRPEALLTRSRISLKMLLSFGPDTEQVNQLLEDLRECEEILQDFHLVEHELELRLLQAQCGIRFGLRGWFGADFSIDRGKLALEKAMQIMTTHGFHHRECDVALLEARFLTEKNDCGRRQKEAREQISRAIEIERNTGYRKLHHELSELKAAIMK